MRLTGPELRRKAQQWDRVAEWCGDEQYARRYRDLARQARVRAASREHDLPDRLPADRVAKAGVGMETGTTRGRSLSGHRRRT